jgi:hypothetical protein
MLEAGGYWRPLAAVARLLEELGELLELWVRERPGKGDLASELADLWIITTALADQFRILVPEPPGPPAPAQGTPAASGLVIAAGRIARVVNYYDGPKLPRSPGELPSLSETIAAFHGELGLLCRALEVDLSAAVDEKFVVIHGREMKRFAREDSDPSTAAVLARLPPDWLEAKLWGGPLLKPGAGPVELAPALAPTLLAFTRAARAEGLEGYVIGLPAGADAAECDRWLADLQAALIDLDPAPAPARNRSADLHFNGQALTLELLPAEPGEDQTPGPQTLALLRLADGPNGQPG